ncbi:hypothetical protein HK102_010518, partial [Quaeritorhiza haematococci]
LLHHRRSSHHAVRQALSRRISAHLGGSLSPSKRHTAVSFYRVEPSISSGATRRGRYTLLSSSGSGGSRGGHCGGAFVHGVAGYVGGRIEVDDAGAAAVLLGLGGAGVRVVGRADGVVGRADILYQLAFERMSEVLELEGEVREICQAVSERLHQPGYSRLTKDLAERPWQGGWEDLDRVLWDLRMGKFRRQLEAAVFERSLEEQRQLRRVFVITRDDAVAFCRQRNIPTTEIVIGGDPVFDRMPNPFPFFAPWSEMVIDPRRVMDLSPGTPTPQKKWDQTKVWTLSPAWSKGGVELRYPYFRERTCPCPFLGPKDKCPCYADEDLIDDPFFPPSMPIGLHREEVTAADGTVETRYFSGATPLSEAEVRERCQAWWGPEFENYYMTFDDGGSWSPRADYTG